MALRVSASQSLSRIEVVAVATFAFDLAVDDDARSNFKSAADRQLVVASEPAC